MYKRMGGKRYIHRSQTEFSNTRSMSVQQVKAYHLHLQKNRTRQIITSLLLVGLLVLQYITMLGQTQEISPPSRGALIQGGVTSIYDIEAQYARSSSAFSALSRHLTISSDDIRGLSLNTTWSSPLNSPLVEWSSTPISGNLYDRKAQTAPTFAINTSSDNVFYGHVLPVSYSPSKEIVFTNNHKAFMVQKSNGAIITSWETAQKFSTCYNTADSQKSFIHCPNAESFHTEISAKNISQKIDASAQKVQPADRLAYALKVKNIRPTPITVSPHVYLEDVLEYAALTDKGGGKFNSALSQLEWSVVDIAPNAEVSYTFHVKIKPSISLAPQPISNASSNDCRISTFFGKEYTLSITCPAPKVIERFLHMPPSILPFIGTIVGIIITLLLLLRTQTMLYKSHHITQLIKEGDL